MNLAASDRRRPDDERATQSLQAFRPLRTAPSPILALPLLRTQPLLHRLRTPGLDPTELDDDYAALL